MFTALACNVRSISSPCSRPKTSFTCHLGSGKAGFSCPDMRPTGPEGAGNDDEAGEGVYADFTVAQSPKTFLRPDDFLTALSFFKPQKLACLLPSLAAAYCISP